MTSFVQFCVLGFWGFRGHPAYWTYWNEVRSMSNRLTRTIRYCGRQLIDVYLFLSASAKRDIRVSFPRSVHKYRES